MSGLILSLDLGEFFRDQVTDARSDLGIEIPEQTEYYLVNLLCEYSKTESTPMPGEEPLALIYKRALEASTLDRIQILKQLGDLSLYTSGFFADFVRRSMVDVDYYISMGGSAYSSLSGMLGAQRQGRSVAELYTQLAKKFEELVELLAQVAERSRASVEGHSDLVKLYDRWKRTGSHRLHKVLIEKGLVFSGDDDSEFHH